MDGVADGGGIGRPVRRLDPAASAAAFARATHIVQLDTQIQRIAGVPIEPRAAIGEYDAATGSYTLYAGMGGAVRPRDDLAAILGVAADRVRVVMHDVGGNFGTRGGFNPEFALVVWAARRVGRPVKWVCERQETSCATTRRAIWRSRSNWPSTPTAIFSPCAAPTSPTSARMRSRSGRSPRAWRSCRASTTSRLCISAPGRC